jgi:maltooligosyltrehalose trehalohydrolase
MTAAGDGWHELHVVQARAGSLYQFVLGDGLAIPDPASRFQPQDAHGPSEVIDPDAYVWRDAGWQGLRWEECVLYELHVGAFTSAGTFRAAIDRLDDLVDLGITALEIMPVADFPGRRNWGYDGVMLFAPDSSYGRPDDFKALVDAAHARGLAVLLDVVYNHFGPDANYLPQCVPLFSATHHTPWGAAINFDGTGAEGVRELCIANALFWIHEYHLDGLRLDAVHAIIDDSPTHLLTELATRARASVTRPLHLILENDGNEASRLNRTASGAPALYTAQWNDDLHHTLHTAATGEHYGYYAAYAGDIHKLGRALAEGFAFQGEAMSHTGKPRGEPSGHLPPTAFISFIQNHDQIGNRPYGERLQHLTSAAALRAISAIYLLAPQIPMLFMGEEWVAAQPFSYFCDFAPPLATAIREGRRREFAHFPEFRDAAQQEKIPDPTAPATFAISKLDWKQRHTAAHAARLDWYKQILRVRHREIVPLLANIGSHSGSYVVHGPHTLEVQWQVQEARRLTLLAHLSDSELSSAPAIRGRVLWQEGRDARGTLAPWSILWTLMD